MSAPPLTPLDYVAAGYWQDFTADRAIAGGIAYETELRHCQLDESLTSLQRIDILLTQIRRDMVKAGIWNEAALLTDEHYRNFMVFLAFYAGRVLAQQWQHVPHWFGQFELGKRYPALPLTADDFYQHMAVVYRGITDNDTNIDTDVTSLFFALEPIGLRLFGHIDRQFESVQGGQVASGLYQAVISRLPNSNSDQVATTAMPVAAVTQEAIRETDTNISVSTNTNAHLKTAKTDNNYQPLEKNLLNKVSIDSDLSEQNNQNKPELSTVQTPLESTKPESAPSVKPIPKPPASEPLAKTSPTPEIFTQLLLELDNVEVAQTSGQTEYQQARKVLDQFEQYIAKQAKPRAQTLFSESHLAAKKQALLKLQQAANVGNTAAMLRLAMYELLDEGLAVDKNSATESGVEWVKQAASKNDSRAQRLLSKMYYQGVGVTQEIANGQYWLEQAAENGHAEAASVVRQWQQAQALMTTQKQEQHSIKRYQLLFVAIVVVAVLIFIIV
ncbi:tetratricopeptide repeat protein [Psychrobacter sp. AOP22-C1-22]|uniref:tetratricopeptide repeat protein n=1 Tax=unclassified Psychrobacter TaxID=196806 RepID=UPI0017884AAE|nr:MULTISPECIES: tetratricopeptide repeat protein [unclassified Psychrobacter]MBE0407099.1 SEL1-like repeat protein [Psychrobacter sp. FME6]MBE0445216.1 SEL1-like repeat protein [Psychrobacter sp. FME5]MDN5801070.1 SEL1-like repeat protein [Psychrobacter sp.]MDN5890816.1 SEL1-like repeat protein [Psychrobacter sp.]